VSERVVYLTDAQWRKIEPLIPKKPVGPKGGRPRAFRRLVARYENYIKMFVAFLELAFVIVTLRKCL
jgi:transposase